MTFLWCTSIRQQFPLLRSQTREAITIVSDLHQRPFILHKIEQMPVWEAIYLSMCKSHNFSVWQLWAQLGDGATSQGRRRWCGVSRAMTRCGEEDHAARRNDDATRAMARWGENDSAMRRRWWRKRWCGAGQRVLWCGAVKAIIHHGKCCGVVGLCRERGFNARSQTRRGTARELMRRSAACEMSQIFETWTCGCRRHKRSMLWATELETASHYALFGGIAQTRKIMLKDLMLILMLKNGDIDTFSEFLRVQWFFRLHEALLCILLILDTVFSFF